MRNASRPFEISQILRPARGPVTSAELAERLEVGQRSIDGDIAALQGMRVAIEGGRGIRDGQIAGRQLLLKIRWRATFGRASLACSSDPLVGARRPVMALDET